MCSNFDEVAHTKYIIIITGLQYRWPSEVQAEDTSFCARSRARFSNLMLKKGNTYMVLTIEIAVVI